MKSSIRVMMAGGMVVGLAIALFAPNRVRADEPGTIIGWIDNSDPNRVIHPMPENPQPDRPQPQPRTPSPRPPQQNPQPPTQQPNPQAAAEQRRAQEAVADNQAGQDAMDAGDWDTAIDEFQSALEIDADNALYQQNLQYAREKLADAQADARRKDQARLDNHLGIEALKQKDWDNALRYLQSASDQWPDNPVYRTNLQAAQKQVARVRQDAAAAGDMSAAIAKMVDTFPSLNDGPNSGDSSSKGDSSGSGLKISDADMVVDARNVPSGLPKSVDDALPRGPSGDRVRKGFECVMEHDWPAAKAWFEDALNHDPGNAGILRLIDLAQFTMHRQDASSLTFEGADAVMTQLYQRALVIDDTPAPGDPELDRIFDDYLKKMLAEHPDELLGTKSPAGSEAVDDPTWQKMLEILGAADMANSQKNSTGNGAGH